MCIRNPQALLARVRSVHEAIRHAVVVACESQSIDELAAVAGDDAGDTVFAIDRVSENVLLEHFQAVAQEWPCLLVAEGLGHDGRQVLPQGARLEDAEIAILVDPIDGTRGLMYQKRSAWILTGIAPLTPGSNTNATPTLADIELAVQTEIPLAKQHLSDVLWAWVGGGVHAERFNRFDQTRQMFVPRPSRANHLSQGFGGISRFFPGARDVLAAMDDEIVAAVLGPAVPGRAQSFEDQYISSAGQLYEIMMGHDRWIADVRPRLSPVLRSRGLPPGMCGHPYDLACELIAREAGVVVTDLDGGRLAAPFDVTTDVGWVGYANDAIRTQVEPVLRAAMLRHGLRPEF